MTQSKEAHAEYMRRRRGSQKGSQTEGSQTKGSQGITGLVTDEQGYKYKVLSDKQRWYPNRHGYHPEGCTCGIEHKERPGC